MTTLQEASTKALDALRKAMQGNLDFDVALEAFEALRTALAQQGEPVYQYQMADGSWIDQIKDSYDYHRKYVPNATVRVVYTAAPAPQAQQGEPVAWAIYDKRGGSKSIHWAEQHTDGNAEMYNAVPLYKAAPAQSAQGELAEIARLHDRIKDFEADVEYLQYTKPAPQPKQEPLTNEAIYSIVLSEFKCVLLPYDIRLARAIEADHGITGMVEAATRPAIDAASKQGG